MMRLSGSVKLYCSLAPGASLGGCGALPRGFLPWARSASRAPSLLSILRALERRTGLRARLDLGPRFGQLRFALLAALHFLGNAQPVLERRAVGVLGFAQQCFDLQIQFAHQFAGPSMATVMPPTLSTPQRALISMTWAKLRASTSWCARRNSHSVS